MGPESWHGLSPAPENLARGDMGAAGAAASAGKAGCGALCSMLGSLGRILADIFSNAEKTSQATLVLCLLLGLGNIIASMIAFVSMHGIRVDLVEMSGDTSNETYAEEVLSLARNFLSMQFGLFAIFVSSIVWGVLVLFDYFKFSVGKSFVLMATLYTVLLLLTHGVCVQTIQATTLKDLEGSWQDLLQRPAVRAPVQFRPRRGDGQVRGGLPHGLPGHRGPCPLRRPHGLLPPGPPRGNHRQAQGHHHHNLAPRRGTGRTTPPDAEMGGAEGGYSPRAPPPAALRQRRL